MLEEIQRALFSAYDIRNSMSEADKRHPTKNEDWQECIETIIDALETLEAQAIAKLKEKNT